jgi:hypothetical protein
MWRKVAEATGQHEGWCDCAARATVTTMTLDAGVRSASLHESVSSIATSSALTSRATAQPCRRSTPCSPLDLNQSVYHMAFFASDRVYMTH